jgi:hypothetical protein
MNFEVVGVDEISLCRNPVVRPFSAIDKAHRCVLGSVLEADYTDSEGLTLTAAQVRQCYEFWKAKPPVFKVHHAGDPLPNIRVVKSAITAKPLRVPGCREVIPAGAWYLATVVSPDLMEKVVKEELCGYSLTFLKQQPRFDQREIDRITESVGRVIDKFVTEE